MRRSRWGRVLAVVYALWVVVVLTEPAALHECAVHDGGHGLAHNHATPTHSNHGHDKAPECSCVGACCVATVATVPRVADVLSLELTTNFQRVSVFSRSDRRPAAVEYARPPSIGPPILPA